MPALLVLAAVALCLPPTQAADDMTVFEVASIKPAAPQNGAPYAHIGWSGGPGSKSPEHIRYENVAVQDMVKLAYGVDTYQIAGPKIVESERFDIEAKIPKGATKEQVAMMLQHLLADRFQLALHRDQRDMPIYSLTVAKKGPKLTLSPEERSETVETPETPNGVPRSSHFFTSTAHDGTIKLKSELQTMDQFAAALTQHLDRPVANNTGLAGRYDISLEFCDGMWQSMPRGMPAMSVPPRSGEPSQSPGLTTAFTDQLGLKLEATKGPVEVLVIDHVEKAPRPN